MKSSQLQINHNYTMKFLAANFTESDIDVYFDDSVVTFIFYQFQKC